jgi:hypothetical protein
MVENFKMATVISSCSVTRDMKENVKNTSSEICYVSAVLNYFKKSDTSAIYHTFTILDFSQNRQNAVFFTSI